MKQENTKITIIILAVIFGLASGIVGGLLSRTYFLGNIYHLPFFGEIVFPNGDYNSGSLIISGAKKVVVEQNTKITETINSVSSSLVGIFVKQKYEEDSSRNSEFDLYNYYRLNQELGQGLIITSDGWIITNVFIENANPKKVFADYVIITKDKKIYNIDNFAQDPISSFSFIHAEKAKDFPVRQFSEKSEIKNGQLVVVINWQSKSYLTSIVGEKDKTSSLIKFSDTFSKELILRDDLSQDYKGSPIFDLAGNIVGLVDEPDKIEPISHFQSAINSLFKNKTVNRPSLGVYYINFFDLVAANVVDQEIEKQEKGTIIYKSSDGMAVLKDSAAEKAGLKEGDIIISVDNIEIDQYNDLADIIQNYLAGDKVQVIYLRNNKEEEVEVELGEIGE